MDAILGTLPMWGLSFYSEHAGDLYLCTSARSDVSLPCGLGTVTSCCAGE